MERRILLSKLLANEVKYKFGITNSPSYSLSNDAITHTESFKKKRLDENYRMQQINLPRLQRFHNANLEFRGEFKQNEMSHPNINSHILNLPRLQRFHDANLEFRGESKQNEMSHPNRNFLVLGSYSRDKEA